MNEITKAFNTLVVRATKDLDSISNPKDRVDSICKLLSTLMDTGALEKMHLLESESELVPAKKEKTTKKDLKEHDVKTEVVKQAIDKPKIVEPKKEVMPTPTPQLKAEAKEQKVKQETQSVASSAQQEEVENPAQVEPSQKGTPAIRKAIQTVNEQSSQTQKQEKKNKVSEQQKPVVEKEAPKTESQPQKPATQQNPVSKEMPSQNEFLGKQGDAFYNAPDAKDKFDRDASTAEQGNPAPQTPTTTEPPKQAQETHNILMAEELDETWTPKMIEHFKDLLLLIKKYYPRMIHYVDKKWFGERLSDASNKELTHFESLDDVPPRLLKTWWGKVIEGWNIRKAEMDAKAKAKESAKQQQPAPQQPNPQQQAAQAQ